VYLFMPPLRSDKLDFFIWQNTFFSVTSQENLCEQVLKKCTDVDLTLLYIWILGTYTKFAWENNLHSAFASRRHARALGCYNLLHVAFHFFSLKSQSVMLLSRSLLPRTAEKRPVSLRLHETARARACSNIQRIICAKQHFSLRPQLAIR